ncbi:MAG: hypothetical protein KDB53_19660, partial [Planctomycetes bacterium]|nr:hypothetical protein [Planctomycetota bacterium]
ILMKDHMGACPSCQAFITRRDLSRSWVSSPADVAALEARRADFPRPLHRRRWFQVSAAAVLVSVGGLGAQAWFKRTRVKTSSKIDAATRVRMEWNRDFEAMFASGGSARISSIISRGDPREIGPLAEWIRETNRVSLVPLVLPLLQDSRIGLRTAAAGVIWHFAPGGAMLPHLSAVSAARAAESDSSFRQYLVQLEGRIQGP